eukprot:6124426-Amphidinium_carterae.1
MDVVARGRLWGKTSGYGRIAARGGVLCMGAIPPQTLTCQAAHAHAIESYMETTCGVTRVEVFSSAS